MVLRTRFGAGFSRVAAILAAAPLIVALAPATPAGAFAGWRTLPSKPTPAYFLAAGSGARIYAVGGYNNGYLSKLEKYDPASNTWSTLASMPTPRDEFAAAAFGGRVYAVGGYNNTNGYLNTLEAYNPSTNSWTTLMPMPTARFDLAAAAAPCHGASGTCLYAIGGNDGSAVLATVEQYNPATNTWSTLMPMPTARTALAAAAGAHVYAVGGYDKHATDLGTLEQYDPPTNTWATLMPMPTPRHYLGAAAFNGNVYALGGVSGTFLATFERFNVASNTWATLTSMPTAREGLAVVAAPCPGSSSTCVYGVGGYSGPTLGTVEAYG
jgi:N-acetylneuraminic acid mutarotase